MFARYFFEGRELYIPAMCHNFPLQSTFQSIFFALFFLVLLAGCAPYKISTQSFLNITTSPDCKSEPTQLIMLQKEIALSHWLYNYIPRHRSQIEWYDIGHWTTWALFGNDDDGIFGEEPTAKYKLDKEISCIKALNWEIRNPLHNFCFYVIGSAYRDNSELTFCKISPEKTEFFTYAEKGNVVFASKNTCLYLGLHGGKPFISLRMLYSQKCRGDFYLGWRCRGNFGIKCLPLLLRKDQDIEKKSATESHE